MSRMRMPKAGLLIVMAAALAVFTAGRADAMIDGITGTAFSFTAGEGHIQAGDGRSLYIWGFSDNNGLARVQYPGPTLKLRAGDSITVTLSNDLPVNVSMVFPGMDSAGVADDGNAADETQGLLAWEVLPGGSVTYTFTATNPGTYYYESGTNPDLQVEMGLFGAIIVYPSDNPEVDGGGRNGGGREAGLTYDMYAYNDLGTAEWNSFYDVEFLFLESEMDDRIHEAVEDAMLANPAAPDLSLANTTDFLPVYWFLNGRNAPDTMLMNAPWMPNQPYSCMPMMHPGERLLMRVIDIGRDMHPYHHHGNHARIIAQDGRLLSTDGSSPDLSYKVFTITSAPGQTNDAIFEWTGEGLGFDPYGHTDPGGPLEPYEDASSHGLTFAATGTALPTPVPHQELLTFGAYYSGSPYLGGSGVLPPGEGGFNPNNAYVYMWHSHNEKEMVNNNIFPGGMMTMLFIEAWPLVP